MELMCRETGRRVELREDEEAIVGRRREWEITDGRVSRCHAQFRRKGATVDVFNESKSVYIQRKTAKRIVEKTPNSYSRVKQGDVVYLLRDGEAFVFGFEVRRRDPSPVTPKRVRVKEGVFLGDRMVFLTKLHIGPMREKVLENGGVVQQEVGEGTDYAIVAEESVEVFRDLYARHPHVKFVKEGFVSESLSVGRKVSAEPYLVYRPTPESAPRPMPTTRKAFSPMETEEADRGDAEGVVEVVPVELPEDYDWIEEYDVVKASETVERLYRHWTHSASPLNLSGALDDKEAEDSDPEASSSVPACNRVCLHPACAALNVCFIQQLNETKRLYHGGKADQFKIKAIDKANRVLESLTAPLRSVQDVKNLKLGVKTTEKLRQVLEEGHIQRNIEMAGDAQEKLFRTFSQVWGAGEATSQKWLAAGCTSLADVRNLPNLTEIQRVGLKYYDEFQKRIPRSEVQSLHEEIRKSVIRVVARMTHSTIRRCKSQVFCAVLGSFVRGKEETGDVDVLISPPESSIDLTASDLLQQILNDLLTHELITPDLHPDKLRRHKEVCASWMGVCFSPVPEMHRRLDIKVYMRPVLPFALNYFIGSRDFVRALRYWCIRPTEETANLARQHTTRANAFQLSDQELTLSFRESHRTKLIQLGLSIPCETETDIFNALGLDYVPPWMRIFSPT